MLLPPVPDLVDFCGDERPDRRRRRRHGRHARARQALPRGQGRRDPLRRALREAAHDRLAASTSGAGPTAGSISPGASRRRSRPRWRASSMNGEPAAIGLDESPVAFAVDRPRASRHRHLSVEERIARGRAARDRRPGGFTAPSSRRPTGRTRSRCSRSRPTSRVPELVPIRYGRMLASPFTFFRGGALLMAVDLAATPVGHQRAALRRCPPREFRRLRLARAPDDVRHQRLRRDPARARGNGT